MREPTTDTTCADYYIPVLKGLPQKDISGVLTILWANDLFKPKWYAIRSKFFSHIHD
jgi:hypothetical protein